MAADKRQSATYQINYWLLGASILGLAVIGGGLYLWYGVAMQRVASQFLERGRKTLAEAAALEVQATEAYQAGRLADFEERRKTARKQRQEGNNLLFQYLTLRPGDRDARLELAEAYGQLPDEERNPRRALELFRGAFVAAEASTTWPLRAQLARMMNESGEWNEAEVEARVVVAAQRQQVPVPEDIADQSWRELSISLANQIMRDGLPRLQPKLVEFGEEPGSVLAVSRQRNPDDWRLAVTLANLYRTTEGPTLLTAAEKNTLEQSNTSVTQFADDMVLSALAKHPTDYRARLAGFAYLSRHAVPGAEIELQAAAELRPFDDRIQAALGLWHLNQVPTERRGLLLAGNQDEPLIEAEANHVAAAVTHLTKAIEFGAKSAEPFSALADAYVFQQQPELAVQTWEKGLEVTETSSPQLYQSLIFYQLAQQHYTAAQERLSQWRQKTQAESRRRDVNPRELNESMRAQDLLQGLLELRQQQVDQAVATFERVITAEGRQGPRVAEIYDLLGKAFLELSSVARSAHYFEQAARLAPDNPAILRQAAQTRSTLGQWELARGHFERLIALQPQLSDWLDYAQLLYRIQLQRPPAERQWLVVETALKRAQQAAEPDSPALADAQWLWSAILLQKSPAQWTPPTYLTGREPVEFLQVVAEWYRAAGNSTQADLVVEAIITGRVDPFEQAVAGIQVLASQANWEAAGAAVSAALDQWPEPAQQQTLRLIAAQLELSQGRSDEAFQVLEQLLRDFPAESRLYAIMANAAIETGQISDSPVWWEERLSQMEGQNGPLQCYFAAARALRKAEASDSDQQAREFLATADTQIRDGLAAQSRWARGIALAARIRDQQWRLAVARRDQAVIQSLRQQTRQLYEQAFEFGDRTPLTVLRLSELTSDAEEAARILSQLGTDAIVGFDPLLTQMVGLRMASGDLRSAEELAMEATRTRPNDVGAWLSLAAVYLRQQRTEEADEIVARAEEIALDGKASRDAIASVFQFHLLGSRISGDGQRREEILRRARRLIEPLVALEPPEKRGFTRGVLLDAIGDDEAAKWYLEYEQRQNPLVDQLEVILDFFARRNVPGVNSQEVAIRIASKLVQLRPNSVPYKSRLSQLLMERGRPEDWEAAGKLIATAEEFGPGTLRGRRAQAIILWERKEVPRETRVNNLNTVVNYLTTVTASNEVTPEDWVLLANAYRELSEWTTPEQEPERYAELRTLALESLARMAQFSRLDPNQLLMLGLGMIELESWEQAERTIERLTAALESQRVPNPGPIALRIDIWRRRGEENVRQRGEPLLTNFLQELDRALPLLDDLQKGRIYVQVAAIWELLEQPAQALEWYHKAAGLNSDLLATLVYALVRDGQKKSALEVCQQAMQTKPTIQLVALLAYILTTGRTSPEEFDVAEPMLELARQQFPNDVMIIGSLANIRCVQPGKSAAAIELYLAGLKLDPNQIVLLNNLATLYGEIAANRDEALTLIDRAIAIAGDIPALLNTKARILANQGRLSEARQLLQSIIRRDADSRYWWQLAEVELRLFEENGAETHRAASQVAWREALKNGIEAATLTPDEYERMETFRSHLAELAN